MKKVVESERNKKKNERSKSELDIKRKMENRIREGKETRGKNYEVGKIK